MDGSRHLHRRRGAPEASRPARRSCGGPGLADSPARVRLPRADQAQGPVAAAADHDRHDVRRRRSLPAAGRPRLPRRLLSSARGAGAVNHWFDRDIDALMTRTADRPIPAGRVSPNAALAFGCVLAGLSSRSSR